jgi:hypothetical protein
MSARYNKKRDFPVCSYTDFVPELFGSRCVVRSIGKTGLRRVGAGARELRHCPNSEKRFDSILFRLTPLSNIC